MKYSSPYVIKPVLIGGMISINHVTFLCFFGTKYSCFLTLNSYKGHCVLLLRNQMISSQEQRITLSDLNSCKFVLHDSPVVVFIGFLNSVVLLLSDNFPYNLCLLQHCCILFSLNQYWLYCETRKILLCMG